jgi:putative methionine-R-sulfoxide reductase with GAF domain
VRKNKPDLDEPTFAKLLEAAYVLQEHNREVRQMEESLELHSEQLRQQEAETLAALQKSQRPEESSRPETDYTLTLAEIVEAQHQIQIRHLESDKAMAVVAERVARITNASGAGIGILDGKTIRYRAGAGAPALPLGSEVPLETAICAICVRTGQVLRTPDVDTEFLFDPELCRQRKIQSLVAVPIYHNGNIVGALELYFDKLRGFVEQDIHTCQLMAGLVTEAIGRDAESALKKSMAAERSSMLAAIEKLKPNLAVLAEDQATGSGAKNSDANAVSTAETFVCWKCGSKLVVEEQFCGKCGAPRVGESDESSMQSKLASALQMQQAGHEVPAAPPNGTSHLTARVVAAYVDTTAANTVANDPTGDEPFQSQPFSISGSNKNDAQPVSSIATSFDEEAIPALLSHGLKRENQENENKEDENNEREGEEAETDLGSLPTTLVKQPDATWSSAAKARDFLEALSETRSPSALRRFWHARRGDFYLAVALILVIGVIRWGVLPSHPVGANGSGTAVSGSATRSKTVPDADLTMFDRLLISLGLAEAPEAPEYKGNPDTQVWIDLHTALYYCPGSDLYGKTPKGRFSTQRDAQLDQFEPASRKACD